MVSSIADRREVKKEQKIFDILYWIFLLNPFVFSGLTSWTGSDLNVLVVAITFVMLSRYGIGIIVIATSLVLSIILSPKVGFYILNIVSLIYASMRFRQIDILFAIRLTVKLWLIMMLVNMIMPGIHYNLFNRGEFSIAGGRGYSAFSPEPVTTALFSGGFYFTFKRSLRAWEKWSILFILIATLNAAALPFLIVLFFELKLRLKAFVLTIFFIFVSLVEFDELRIYDQFSNLFGKEEILNIDLSLSNRFNSIRACERMIKENDWLGFDYSNILVSKWRVPLTIPAGFLVWLPQIGIFAIIFWLWLLTKTDSILKIALLVLAVFTGSLAHLFPLFLWFQKSKS